MRNSPNHLSVLRLLAFITLTVFIFVQCDSEEENNIPEEKIYTAILQDYFFSETINTNTIAELFNGTRINIEIVDQNNNYASVEGIEVRNSSNDNVEIILRNNLLLLKTESYTDEPISFDIFYRGTKLTTVNLLIKVLYKVKKDGVDLVGDQKLQFSNDHTPIDLEIYRIDGNPLEDFDPSKASISFQDDTIDESYLENFEIYPGYNFKLIFEPFDQGHTTKKLSLYYLSFPETQNRPVFVKDIEIEVLYTTNDNCNAIKTIDNVVFPNGSETNNRNYRYEFQDSKAISVITDNCIGCRKDYIFYNSQEQVIEIQEYVEYSYNQDNLLSETIIYSNGSKENGLYVKHHYNMNKEKISKTYYNSNGVRGDSIAFSNFINNKPLKVYSYDKDNLLTSYSEREYDASGNLIKTQSSSIADSTEYDSVVEYEYSNTYSRTIYPLEGIDTQLIFEDADFFIEKPVRTKLKIMNLPSGAIDFQEDFLSYEEVNNTVTIEFQYQFSNPATIYAKTLEFSSVDCN